MSSGFENHAALEGHSIESEGLYNSSVGCVTCFYNEEEIIEETLENLDSALEETESIESWYLVDDGSTDGAAELLAEYASESETVEFIEMGKNTGKFGAQKHATEQMDEEYWLSIDADSYIENPEDFDEFISRFEQSNSAATMLNIEPETREPEDGIISNYISKALESMQDLEYSMRFGVDTYTSNADHSKIITASGTATLGETEAILDAMDEHTGEYAGDDRQLTSILELKHGEEVEYNDDIIIGTNSPNNYKELLHQRATWAEGRINAVSALPKEHLKALKSLKDGDRYSQVLTSDLGMASLTPVATYGGIEAAATGNVETLAAGYGVGLGVSGVVYANARMREQIGSEPGNLKELANDAPKLAAMPLYQSAVATPTILSSFKEKFFSEPVQTFKEGYKEGKK